MKKVIGKITILTLITLLAGCSKETLVFFPYTFEGQFESVKTPINETNYYRNESYDEFEYIDFYGNQQTISNFRDLYSSTNIVQQFLNAESIGEANFLVIPINFLDSDKSKNEAQLNMLQCAFFGSEECNQHESLSSFYHKSSYGQLKIGGHISSFYDYPYTSKEIVQTNPSSVSASRKVAFDAIKWFYETNEDFDFSKYDLDGDKYLDGVFFIYNFPYSVNPSDNNGIFWAYADHSYRGEKGNNGAINNQEICLSSYTWISIDFLGSEVKPDARTIIHECGHIFGLEDYYNTSSSGVYQPTGFADMMDANIGDHTGFSKMLLNWTTPMVIKDEGEVTLKPFHSSGDLILIPTSRGYNNTPYDEYLLLEYYQPEGLNKNDAGIKYLYTLNGKQHTFSFFTKPGLKVYHIDARLGLFSFKNTNSLITTLDDPLYETKINEYKQTTQRAYCIDFANSNDVINGREDTTNTLISYLENTNNSKLKKGYAASNDTLWYQGAKFGVTSHQDFVFNNGGAMDYTFEITKLDETGVTIKFVNK